MVIAAEATSLTIPFISFLLIIVPDDTVIGFVTVTGRAKSALTVPCPLILVTVSAQELTLKS